MNKHTEGPWTAGAFHVHSAESVICDCVLSQNSNLPTEEKIANIRLIASAPDLLAICEETADALESNDPDLSLYWIAGRLRKALAKARGEEE